MTHPILLHAKEVMQAKGLTPADLARTTGISQSAISQLFADKYPGKTDEMLRKIADATGYSTSDWRLLSTPNLRTIERLFEDARQNSRMMAIYGETGMGKSSALTWLNSKTQNSYYVLADVLMKQKDLLRAIQRSLGSDHEGTIVERANDIVTRLLAKHKPTLIIDDIGKLREHPKCFYLLQLIFDRTEGRCAIILAGTKAFPSFIQKQAARDCMGFRELKRRISYWQPLKERVELSFVKAVCEQQGITLPSAIDYIAKTCTNYGDVRELITNYNRYAEIHGKVAEDEQQQVLSSLKFGNLSL
ncbi:MAG: AAA family ATPase [Bacteroidetes bacterium]|nr:AAA family ATPase [Bacteroidota bacterium]